MFKLKLGLRKKLGQVQNVRWTRPWLQPHCRHDDDGKAAKKIALQPGNSKNHS